MKISIKPIFRWYDFWIGIFISYKRNWPIKTIYFFPIPMFGIKIKIEGKPLEFTAEELELYNWQDDYHYCPLNKNQKDQSNVTIQMSPTFKNRYYIEGIGNLNIQQIEEKYGKNCADVVKNELTWEKLVELNNWENIEDRRILVIKK